MKTLKIILFVLLSALSGAQMYAQTDPTPDWAWAKNVTAAGNLFVDASGNSYIANQGTQLSITKYDATGTVVWTRIGSSGTGSINPSDIAVDAAGNYYVTGSYTAGSATFGSTTLTNAGGSDVFVVKYDSSGAVLWAQKYGGSGNDMGNSIAVDISGNSYIGGYYNKIGSVTIYIFSTKINSSGVIQWTQAGIMNGEVKGVSVDNFGNSYTVSYIWDQISTNSYQQKYSISKFDPSGNTVWSKTVTGIPNDIVTDGNGNSYITGATYSNDIFTTKYDAAGQVVWTQTASGADNDGGNGIAIDTAGNCYVTGVFQHSVNFASSYISNPNSGVSDIFVVKYDTLGNFIWAQQAGASGIDEGHKIGVDAAGNCYINGVYTTSVGFGTTTLNGTVSNPFLAKVGAIYITSVGNALVKGDNFCGGAVVTVDYAISGKFNSANVFTAQLSNASGSFANPTTIGILASTLNTSIYAIIPSNIPVGSGYRIRVISSSPALIGTDNGINLKLNQTNCVNNTVVLTASPIAAMEYFIDTDPGVGLGTPISITSGMTIDMNTKIKLPTLTTGFHNLFFRTKDVKGNWSMYEGRVFYVQPTTVVLTAAPIATAEYFFDTDPGVGKATALASFTTANDISLNRQVSVTGLTSGFHNLFFRTKNTNGKWSMYEGRVVYIQPTVAATIAEPIVSGEYFFDKDLGAGKGIAINTGASTDFLALNLPSIATSPLLKGTHNVFIRVKNKAGKWGMAERREFNICSSVLASPVVTGNSTLCPESTLNLAASNVIGATSYSWTGPNNFTATTQSITIAAVSGLEAGTYTVAAVNGTTVCGAGNPTKINVLVNETPGPTGLVNQTLASGKTIEDIIVTGIGIKWYNSESDASAEINSLLPTVVIQNGKTYYATQTLNGCKSINSLAVFVTSTLTIDDFDKQSIFVYPNPAKNQIYIQTPNNLEFDKIIVTDLTGKTIIEQATSAKQINIEKLASGMYILQAFSGEEKFQSKFIKE